MAPTPRRLGQPLLRQQVFSRHAVSISAARAFAEHTLDEWRIADRVEDIQLCISELATNTLVHTASDMADFLVR
ncbi:hypothetical protein ACH429_22690 [Streptomyces pathocidini]|uniref:Uncharacterized protein n=2 Tax=Streptomyces pathocidini TaxID=1650571 RepID=A0ABW7V1N3_9ACTN